NNLVGVEPALWTTAVQVFTLGLAHHDRAIRFDVRINSISYLVLAAGRVGRQRPCELENSFWKQVKTGVIKIARSIFDTRLFNDFYKATIGILFDNAVLRNVLFGN